ncbi:MAG: hypothetical protein IK134_13090 [Oscillospiraceae bacterium]|nr:hypothetical protein [Oscillospiraceae bacterium]
MQHTYQAKVIKLEHVRENGVRRSIYTLEYEENGETKQITAENEPSSWVDEGAVIEITVEDGKLLRTSIGKCKHRHNLIMIACFLLFWAVVFGWIALIVTTKSQIIRWSAIAAGGALVLWIFHST